MEFLNRNEIDIKRWDKMVHDSEKENIFCYSWYLDAVAQHWGAFVIGDYETIIPIPYSSKLGVKSIYTPPFTREIDFFGKDVSLDEMLFSAARMYRGIHFRNRDPELEAAKTERIHQYINLREELKYSTNAKRLIKKAAEHYKIKEASDPTELIELFHETSFQKIDSITSDDLTHLKKLMDVALDKVNGELFEVYKDGAMVAGGFFLRDRQRVTFLKSAATAEAKKEGAMFLLMDFAIKRYKEGFDTFDFGGSDVESVANFYKKFGAQDRTYYNYSIDNLPLWFKTLKRFKG